MGVEIDLEKCVGKAREAALEAWRVIEPYYQGDYEIYEKRGEGPATDADIAADHAIIEMLKKDFPPSEFGYLTEETEKDPERLKRDLCWIIDPIDGTREFIAGRNDFAVHIGLAGRPAPGEPLEALLGIVYIPRENVLYSGWRGGGAWAEEPGVPGERRRLRVAEMHVLSGARMVVTRQRVGTLMQAAINRLGVREVYHMGSLGVKVSEVLEGRAALYLNTGYKGCKEWDVCAPAAILQEAGGKITDLAGNPITYNKKDFFVHHGILASNGFLHNAALRCLSTEDLA